MGVSRSKRVLLLILAAFILASSVAGGPLAGSSGAQEDTQPPEWFNGCQKDKFSKLTPEEKEQVADQPTERGQKDALRGVTTAKDIECGDNNENKDPPSDIAEEEDPEKQQERKEDEQKDNQDKQDRNDEADENYNDQSEPSGLGGMAVGMFKAVGGWMMGATGSWAESNAKRMADQFTEGRYQTTAPNDELMSVYEKIGDFTKPAAIALLLILGLSMTLRTANYNTAYAAQHGIPKIVVVLAGIAFFPEIMTMLADLSQGIIDQLIEPGVLEEGMRKVYEGNVPRYFVGLTTPIWIIKLILNLLLYISVVVKNFLFGLLFVVGPLAMIFHAIPKFSDITGAWLRGVLACLVIPILWALEFGVGYRFVANPDMISGGSGAVGIPSFLLSLAIVYIAYKTPWKVYEWAFYSYSAGGGGGIRTAIAAVGLLKGRGGSGGGSGGGGSK